MLEIYDDQCSLYYRCLSIKRSNWHQKDPKQASAPLILDPTGGSLTKDALEVCANFEKVTGMRISVVERAGQAVKHLAKPEPLRKTGCGRENCFPCKTGGGKRKLEKYCLGLLI